MVAFSTGSGEYARPTTQGRAHATQHHYVAERFFGRSTNRRGEQRERIFERCPWNLEMAFATYCYECHEELLHNPVLTPEDIREFAQLVRSRELHEDQKPELHSTSGARKKDAARIQEKIRGDDGMEVGFLAAMLDNSPAKGPHGIAVPHKRTLYCESPWNYFFSLAGIGFHSRRAVELRCSARFITSVSVF